MRLQDMTIGREINLMRNYPQVKRDILERLSYKTENDKFIAQKFGKEFFDGKRNHGYGGFAYNPKFWQPVIPDFKRHWNLVRGDKVLDIGCAKGFMLYDLMQAIPGIEVHGIDVSEYAILKSKEEVSDYCQIGNAIELPFEDKSIDVSISITTLHNLIESDIVKALLEIERVSSKGSFITVDAYRSEEEKDKMEAWNLTAKTVMHIEKWKEFFADVGYTGDYYWFIP